MISEVGYGCFIAFNGFVLVGAHGMKGFAEVMNIGIDEKGAMVEYAFLLLKDVLGVAGKLYALIKQIVAFRVGCLDAEGEQGFSDGF